MNIILDKLLILSKVKRKWISVLITVSIAELLAIWGIYGIGKYGIALFLIVPIILGAGSTILYGYKNTITKKESILISFLSLGFFTIGIILFAIEGLICIVMTAHLGILFTWFGSLIGYYTINKISNKSLSSFILLIIVFPIMAFIEKDEHPQLTTVISSIEINTSPDNVWKHIIEFPQLEEPNELIFKIGISYPINANIEGRGINAIRYCNFSTGSFVEPITVWEEPYLLKFDVEEQPPTMKELSFWDIDSPHLHDYFVSKQGQFKLKALPNGKTLLEGTTLYYNNIKPTLYWQIWSDYIIHKIHKRVLEHIKKNAENDKKSSIMTKK